ncbi:hypothetical protein [Aestuariispira insulae]|uniref:Uncharacterized protein n=1 Tax=Aestuariispira insulae TaxID=1461337 RepID=A0A3D9HJT4_9PROT|nr:hypothetical protein [Aestuariispira insulae]RED49769.1 hypothetical protein DFP90_105140 [Aestuariispira insulae]
MVNSISGFVGIQHSVSTLLDNITNPKKPGEFTPKATGVINIQTTLDNAKQDATKQLIIRGALNRLEGIRQGLIDPSEDWETTAGYLMLTGQPFRLLVDEVGNITTEAQIEGDLDGYNDVQKAAIRQAAEDFKSMGEAVDLQNTREGFRSKLVGAVIKLVQLEQHFPAIEQWEKDFQLYEDIGVPVKVALNADGELIALNQLDHDFSEYENEEDQLKLLAARDRLERIIDGTATASQLWEFTALGYHSDRDNYFLGLDDNGDVAVFSNVRIDPDTSQYTADHLIPDFLKVSNDAEIKTTAQWQDDAISLYQDNRPFMFDFDYTGQLVTRSIDFNSVMGLHKPIDRSDLILQAQLNLLA